MFHVYNADVIIFLCAQVIEWTEVTDEDDLNVQGTLVARSEDSVYIALRDPSNYRQVVFYYLQGIYFHDDPWEVRGIAIANNGFAIVSFGTATSSAVRILLVSKSTTAGGTVNERDSIVDFKNLGFGSGIAITPSADKVAIGDSQLGQVYIRGLNKSSGKLSSTDKHTLYAPATMTSAKFGDKVGFSTTGNSISIAAPLYKIGDVQVGSVLLYFYNSVTSSWEDIGSVLYGNGNNLRLGEGGVTVNDILGRVDANDISGERLSYQVSIFIFKCCLLKDGNNIAHSTIFVPFTVRSRL